MREFPKMGSWIYEGKPLYFRQIFGLWNMVIYPDRWHQPIGPFHWWGGNRTMPNCWLFDWVFRGRQMLRPQTWAWNPKRSLWKGRISFFQSCILFGLSSVKSKQYSLEKNANLTKRFSFLKKKHPFLVVTFVQPFCGGPPSIDINRSSLGSCTDRWAAEQGGDGDDVMWDQWPVDNPQELAVHIGNYGFTQQRSQAMLKSV